MRSFAPVRYSTECVVPVYTCAPPQEPCAHLCMSPNVLSALPACASVSTARRAMSILHLSRAAPSALCPSTTCHSPPKVPCAPLHLSYTAPSALHPFAPDKHCLECALASAPVASRPECHALTGPSALHPSSHVTHCPNCVVPIFTSQVLACVCCTHLHMAHTTLSGLRPSAPVSTALHALRPFSHVTHCHECAAPICTYDELP